jgi:hypothetical protein
MTLFQDSCRIFGAKTSDIFIHDKSLIIGYSRTLNPGYRRGLYKPGCQITLYFGRPSYRGLQDLRDLARGSGDSGGGWYAEQ